MNNERRIKFPLYITRVSRFRRFRADLKFSGIIPGYLALVLLGILSKREPRLSRTKIRGKSGRNPFPTSPWPTIDAQTTESPRDPNRAAQKGSVDSTLPRKPLQTLLVSQLRDPVFHTYIRFRTSEESNVRNYSPLFADIRVSTNRNFRESELS